MSEENEAAKPPEEPLKPVAGRGPEHEAELKRLYGEPVAAKLMSRRAAIIEEIALGTDDDLLHVALSEATPEQVDAALVLLTLAHKHELLEQGRVHARIDQLLARYPELRDE